MFVTFEGPEGAGKSTVIRSMADVFGSTFEVVVTREPGGTEIGAALRSLLLTGSDLAIETELMLFLADRAEHVQSVIKPAIRRGALVLCDRFFDSTMVYQGYARDIDRDFLRECNRFVSQGLVPDLTLLLDLPVEVGLSRIEDKDRMDSLSLEFHRKVRDGFLAEARLDPKRWVVLDAQLASTTVAELAANSIREKLAE